MKKISLKATLREEKRDNGSKNIPAVLYGPEIKESKKIWVDLQAFNKTLNDAGESTLFDLEVDGDKEPYSVLIHDVQYHPVTGESQHVDFYKVKKGKKIETSVEIEFVGEAPAVKERGGILVKNLDSIEIRCLPKDLIGEIKVDLSQLKEVDDMIHIDELGLPEAIEPLADLKTVIVSIAAPRTQEEIDELDEKVEMDIDQVEGIKDKNEEEAESKESSPEKDKTDKEEK